MAAVNFKLLFLFLLLSVRRPSLVNKALPNFYHGIKSHTPRSQSSLVGLDANDQTRSWRLDLTLWAVDGTLLSDNNDMLTISLLVNSINVTYNPFHNDGEVRSLALSWWWARQPGFISFSCLWIQLCKNLEQRLLCEQSDLAHQSIHSFRVGKVIWAISRGDNA